MSLRKLSDLATKLDAEGKTKAASLIDAAMIKLSQQDDLGELIDFPEPEPTSEQLDLSRLPSLSDEINEYEEEGQLEALRAFAEALVDGAFSTIEEAQDAAKHFLAEYPPAKEEVSVEEPPTDDVGLSEERTFGEGFEPKDVIEFPGAAQDSNKAEDFGSKAYKAEQDLKTLFADIQQWVHLGGRSRQGRILVGFSSPITAREAFLTDKSAEYALQFNQLGKEDEFDMHIPVVGFDEG